MEIKTMKRYQGVLQKWKEICVQWKRNPYTHFFYLCNTFTSNVRLKFAKNQTKAKQNLEAKLKAKNL